MRGVNACAVGLAVVLGAACNASDAPAESARTDACAWIAGTWAWSGCDEDTCTFWQDHCDVHYECSSRENVVRGGGTIMGNTFTFDGAVCVAEIRGRTMMGTCTAAAQQCAFRATHR